MLKFKKCWFMTAVLSMVILGPNTDVKALDANGSMVETVLIEVSISTQVMKVHHNGQLSYEWPVSTARHGKVTPIGAWRAKWLSRNHRSTRYNNAPMPYSIFYNGHYAVHGTNQINLLGRPASAGCIRLHPDNAAILFSIVQGIELQNTTISVVE